MGGRIQLCIRFQCLGNEYWDSNNGGNYVFQYVSGGRPTSINADITPSNQMNAIVPNRGIPITARGREPGRSGSQRVEGISHVYQPMSHSPSALDDPWQQFM